MFKTRKIALSGLLFAVALVLSWLENFIPALPSLPPGIKPGLSNVVMLFCLYYAGLPYGVSLALLKSLFVYFTRGFTAAILSFSGGILSVAVMILLIRVANQKCSKGIISVCGACSHNIGQLLAVYILTASGAVFYYTPILLLSGVIMGLLTGYIFTVLAQYIDSISLF